MYHIKKDKRSLRSCERIYLALITCMKENAYDDITIKDLAEQAHVARATFYRNFDTLDDVLSYEVDRKFDELFYYLYSYYHEEPDFFLSFFITPFLKFWEQDATIIKLLLESGQLGLLRQAFDRLLLRGIDKLDPHQSVTKGLTIQDLKVSSDINYFLALRSGIAINLLTQWVKDGQSKSAEDVTHTMITLMSSDLNANLFGRT